MEALEWVELDLVGLESSMEGRVLEMETSGQLERSMNGLRPTMFMLQEMEVLEWSDLQLNWLDRSMEDSRAPEALSVEFWLPTLTLPVDTESFWALEAELGAEEVLRAVAIVMEDFIPAAEVLVEVKNFLLLPNFNPLVDDFFLILKMLETDVPLALETSRLLETLPLSNDWTLNLDFECEMVIFV